VAIIPIPKKALADWGALVLAEFKRNSIFQGEPDSMLKSFDVTIVSNGFLVRHGARPESYGRDTETLVFTTHTELAAFFKQQAADAALVAEAQEIVKQAR
jgi:hypothetical protein